MVGLELESVEVSSIKSFSLLVAGGLKKNLHPLLCYDIWFIMKSPKNGQIDHPRLGEARIHAACHWYRKGRTVIRYQLNITVVWPQTLFPLFYELTWVSCNCCLAKTKLLLELAMNFGSREDKISPHHMALLKPWWLEKNTLKKRTQFFWNSKTSNSPTPIFIVTLKTKECISNSTEWFFGIPIVRHFNYSFGVAQTESRWSGQESSS